jgi:ubiquinone/menaquinone biosynthesis C-methylase UbiE
VADLGCGPGLLALEIARQVGSTGEVQCIDASDSSWWSWKVSVRRLESWRAL